MIGVFWKAVETCSVTDDGDEEEEEEEVLLCVLDEQNQLAVHFPK